MQYDHTKPLDSFDALALGLPTKIRFVIDNGGGLLEAKGFELITLGRQVENATNVVDLAAFDGAKFGVSRRHAQISPEKGHLVIQDLQSANGTFLNGEQLAPDTAYILRHGDQVRLGQMQLEIWFLGGNYGGE